MTWSVGDQKTQIRTLLSMSGLILSVIGFLTGTYVILVAGIFFLMASFAARLYLLYLIRHLTLENKDLSVSLSAGESGTLTLEFASSARLPFYSLSGRMTGESLFCFSDHPERKAQEFHFRMTVPAKKKIIISCPVFALQRGTGRIRALELKSADPFHILSCTLTLNEMIRSRIIIYPKPEMIQNSHAFLHDNAGFTFVPSSLYQDETAPAGTRDYQLSDPFRQIHWKASARLGKLQTKTFEKVAQISWTFLFLSAPVYRASQTTETFESCLSAAAYLTGYACRHQIPYDLFSNTKPMGTQLITGLAETSGRMQLKKAWTFLSFLQIWQMKTRVDQAARVIHSKLTAKKVIFIMDLDPDADANRLFVPWIREGHQVYQLKRSEKGLSLAPVRAEEGAFHG
jgi:Uncharacterized conserved protein (some members contain a von Willebrand factor type A (vWA) domain)